MYSIVLCFCVYIQARESLTTQSMTYIIQCLTMDKEDVRTSNFFKCFILVFFF